MSPSVLPVLLFAASAAGSTVFCPSIDPSLARDRSYVGAGAGSSSYASITVGNALGGSITANLTLSSGAFDVINLPPARDYPWLPDLPFYDVQTLPPESFKDGYFRDINGPAAFINDVSVSSYYVPISETVSLLYYRLDLVGDAAASATFAFSEAVNEFRINFAGYGTTGSTTLLAEAYMGSTLVGSQAFGSANPLHYDEGQVDFIGDSSFDRIVLSLQGAPNIAPLWVLGTPIPESSTYGLALGGLALVGAVIRRRKTSK